MPNDATTCTPHDPADLGIRCPEPVARARPSTAAAVSGPRFRVLLARTNATTRLLPHENLPASVQQATVATVDGASPCAIVGWNDYMKVGETELWFKQRVVELMNQLIREQGLGFERADAEQSIAMGKKHRFADAVLWKHGSTEPVCEMEFKRPFVDAADFELVNDAAAKANIIGAKYFLTWNVRDLVLWETFVPGKPLLERRWRWWSDIVDVADVTELEDHHWEKIKAFLGELLRELDGLYNHGKRFDKREVDEFFVRKLSSVVASNYRVYASSIRKRCQTSKNYYDELRKWTADHGWSALLKPDSLTTDPGAFDVLGRLAIFLLMNRVIFYNLVRTKHSSLPAMSLSGLRSGADFEARLRKYFNAVLEIDFATVFAADVFDQVAVSGRQRGAA